ncbi:MAG: hypothetical protein M3N53_10145 [Actinomycetota bacterium]|nr:hypothetical protein [Actinomycetota bacterium]
MKPKLRIVSIEGDPSAEERAAVEAALEKMIEEERRARAASVWKRAARAQGRRLGNFDYRDRFDSADAWRLSTRFPFGGREYPGLNGRGDAK